MEKESKPQKISLEILEKYNYLSSGIGFEIDAAKLLGGNIRNLEKLWSFCAVPMTNRIYNDPPKKVINDHRDDVHIEIKKIGITLFSILFNFYHSKEYIKDSNKNILRFNYFYIHAATVCDLLEGLIYRFLYLFDYLNESEITNLITSEKINRIRTYIKEFVENDECKELSYPKNREIMKNILIKFFNNENLLEHYLQAQKNILDYRNLIVHQSFVSFIEFNGKSIFPKRNFIDYYKIKLHATYEINKITDLEKNSNFEVVNDLLNNDFDNLIINVENIFSILVKKFKKIVYEDQNPKILKMYNIKVID